MQLIRTLTLALITTAIAVATQPLSPRAPLDTLDTQATPPPVPWVARLLVCVFGVVLSPQPSPHPLQGPDSDANADLAPRHHTHSRHAHVRHYHGFRRRIHP